MRSLHAHGVKACGSWKGDGPEICGLEFAVFIGGSAPLPLNSDKLPSAIFITVVGTAFELELSSKIVKGWAYIDFEF